MKRGLPGMNPGEWLREEVLKGRKLTQTALAEALGISWQTLHDILQEKQPVTPQMALRLSKVLGTTPEFWLNLQQSFDLEQAAKLHAETLAKLKPLQAA